MELYKSLDISGYILLGLFLLAYSLYIIRMVRVNREIRTGFGVIIRKLILRTSYFVLFLLALMGPLFGNSTKKIKAVGKDIYFAVDLSASMNAEDIQPSRLQKVKFELKNIVNSFAGDRMGLIIFSSEAFMQCPLTFDQSALNLFIETLNTRLVPDAGTDFGPPLRMALNKINNNESPNPQAQQKSKIVILISDGEDFGENTLEIANEIKNNNINLYTLGVGTRQGARIMERNRPKTDRQGNVVITKLDASMLKKLANITDGAYFEINKTQNDVERLINTIRDIEGEIRETRQIDVSSNKYAYFLGLGLVLFLIDNIFKFKTINL